MYIIWITKFCEVISFVAFMTALTKKKQSFCSGLWLLPHLPHACCPCLCIVPYSVLRRRSPSRSRAEVLRIGSPRFQFQFAGDWLVPPPLLPYLLLYDFLLSPPPTCQISSTCNSVALLVKFCMSFSVCSAALHICMVLFRSSSASLSSRSLIILSRIPQTILSFINRSCKFPNSQSLANFRSSLRKVLNVSPGCCTLTLN